jgi:hypothetical protein
MEDRMFVKRTYRSAAGSIAGTPDIAELAGGADLEVLGGHGKGHGAEEGDGAEEDGGELHFASCCLVEGD